MRIFWKTVRVVKWAALVFFLFTVAFVPWGWTVTAAAVLVYAAYRVTREQRRPPGRHAAARPAKSLEEFRFRLDDGEQVRLIAPKQVEVHDFLAPRGGRHAA